MKLLLSNVVLELSSVVFITKNRQTPARQSLIALRAATSVRRENAEETVDPPIPVPERHGRPAPFSLRDAPTIAGIEHRLRQLGANDRAALFTDHGVRHAAKAHIIGVIQRSDVDKIFP